jgi:hypothetical protein
MPSKFWKTATAIPLARLLAAAQIVLMARRHWHRLEPHERRRLIALERQARGRPRNLPERDRAELQRLIAKADPRLFMGLVAQRFSPVRLPQRLVRGARH